MRCWGSKQLTTKEQLAATHTIDRAKGLTSKQIQQVKIYMVQCKSVLLSAAVRATGRLLTDKCMSRQILKT